MARRRCIDTRTLDLFAPHVRAAAALSNGSAAAIAAPHFHALKPDAIELRPYTDLARAAWSAGDNFGIVADTSSGKTYLALLLADDVLGRGQRVLVCAPTNPLCDQHERVARTLFDLPMDAIAFVRSSTTRRAREAWASARIIIATPQRVVAGLTRGRYTLDGFGLVVIDECHHAAERYAAIDVARDAAARGIRIVGLTASPGDDAVAIERVRKNLHLDRWVEVPDEATDPFRPPVRKRRIMVPLPEPVAEIVRALEDEILAHTTILATDGYLDRPMRTPAPNDLTAAITAIRKREAYMRIPNAAAALSLTTALTALVAGDLTHALEILRSAVARRTSARTGARRTATAALLRGSPAVVRAGLALRALVDAGEIHPKWAPLVAAIREARTESPTARVLVYTRYATTAGRLADALGPALGCTVATVLGRAHMKPAEAIQRLDAFARGDTPVIVASPVIREGLHIPAIDLLVEYAPPLNGIERKQLHGRVGRTASGTVIALVANHDLDQRYAYSAEAGVRRMRLAIRGANDNVAPTQPQAHHTRRSAFTGRPQKSENAMATSVRSGVVFERFAVRNAAIRSDSRHRPYVELVVGDRSGDLIVRHWCPDGMAQAHAVLAAAATDAIIIVRGYLERADDRTIIVNPREGQSVIPCPATDADPADYAPARIPV